MKKFLQMVMELKNWICLSFTASLLIYIVIDILVPGELPPGNVVMDIAWCWSYGYIKYRLVFQLLGLCLCISILQYVFFSGQMLKKPSYFVRIAVFGVLCLGLCTGATIAFGWFSLDSLEHWGKFFLIFVVCFVGISLGFEVYYRAMGKRYNEALGRKQKEAPRE